MNYEPIVIVAGEPNSVFLELFFKSYKKNKVKSPLILFASLNVVELQMRKLKFKKKIKILDKNNLDNYKLNNNHILFKTT